MACCCRKWINNSKRRNAKNFPRFEFVKNATIVILQSCRKANFLLSLCLLFWSEKHKIMLFICYQKKRLLPEISNLYTISLLIHSDVENDSTFWPLTIKKYKSFCSLNGQKNNNTECETLAQLFCDLRTEPQTKPWHFKLCSLLETWPTTQIFK